MIDFRVFNSVFDLSPVLSVSWFRIRATLRAPTLPVIHRAGDDPGHLGPRHAGSRKARTSCSGQAKAVKWYRIQFETWLGTLVSMGFLPVPDSNSPAHP